MKKRIFSLLLALGLVAGLLPTVAYAYENDFGSTIDSDTFDEEVTNRGTINGGTFNKAVTNSGTIDNGEFNNTVTNTPGSYINNGTFNGIVYSRGGCNITGGTFNNTVNNDSASDYISGGTFNGTVNNNAGAKIQDGTFYSTVNNNALCNIFGGTFYGTLHNNTDSYITGGTFYGDVENNGTITGGTFYGAVSGTGTISDSAVIWTKLTQKTIENYRISSPLGDYYSLPSGHYYLGGNISVGTNDVYIGTISTPANVVLDLNSHEFRKDTNGVLIFLRNNSTLTLIDGSSSKTGKVINSLGDTVILDKNSKLNANGGTIEGNVDLHGENAEIDNTDPSNVTVFREGQIYGATSSTIINSGIFYSTVGTVGTVYNYNGQITGGIFYGTVNCDKIRESAKVTVAFNSDGGSTVDEQKVLRGQKATEPEDPTKAGYSFEGWYNGNTAFNFANTHVTENITLTAKWAKVVTATISAIPDATYTGSDIEPAVTVYDGQTVIPASEYTVSYSDNKNVGTATVTLTDKAGGNYAVTGTTTFEILPKSISDAVVTLNGALTYNGTEQTQNVTVTLAGFDTVTFDVSGNKQTDVNTSGDYTLTVTGNGNFTGSKNLDWNIAPATPAENSAKKTTARVVRGRTLADATVTNGEILGVDGTTPLTGTFAWVDSTKVMRADGTEQMVFTPDDTNYVPITIDVAVSTYSSGGGSSSSTYAINVESTKNGTVTINPKNAANGTTVTLTIDPDKGYTLETLIVTDGSGKEVKLTEKNGKYTFTMPASKVTVTATFMEDNSMLNFFVDVPANAYYYDAVLWAAENGITGGVDDTHFAPNAPCTRAQIVTFLWRAAGCPEPESLSSFADVSADSYYAKAVAWAVENGITGGTGNGMFSPNATCTRAQAMAFIYRSQQARGGGMQGAWMFLNPFSDVNLESYYGEAVMWAVANGVTDGTTATSFSPNANCTRGQIVTFLFRCLGEE